MVNNNTLNSGYTRGVLTTTLAKDFALFDNLPKYMRDILNYAPIKLAAEPLFIHQPSEQHLRQQFNKTFHNWKPLFGDPL